MKDITVTVRTRQSQARVVNKKANEVKGVEATDYRFSAKESKFIDGILEGKRQYQAYEDAGYTGEPASLRQNSSRLRATENISAEIDRRFKEIEQAVFGMLVAKAQRAAEVSDELMESSTREDVIRLKAAESILDRGGFTSKRRMEIVADITQKVTVVDLILGIAEDEEEEFLMKIPEEGDEEETPMETPEDDDNTGITDSNSEREKEVQE